MSLDWIKQGVYSPGTRGVEVTKISIRPGKERKMAVDIVRAWKDPEYRKTLSPEELASVPPPPAGSADLTDEELSKLAGSRDTRTTDIGTCVAAGCRL